MSGSVSTAVGRRVAARRTELRLSQQALSDRLAAGGYVLRRSSISEIESGHRAVTVDELVALVEALDTTTDHLLDGSPQDEQDAGERLIPEDVLRAAVTGTWADPVFHTAAEVLDIAEFRLLLGLPADTDLVSGDMLLRIVRRLVLLERAR